MKLINPEHASPSDAQERKSEKPVVCYPVNSLPDNNLKALKAIKKKSRKVSELVVNPRQAGCIEIPKGCFFKIVSVEGPQVGDLNLWNLHDQNEKFFAGKTRALHGTHLSTGDRLWSNFPYLRPMATIVDDTLDWYKFDEFGTSVHDVIGTRCDPYTEKMLSGLDYHHCCHSNLTKAFGSYLKIDKTLAETLIHDVLNVFMCTGFSGETGQYIMKASPVRPGDFLEFYAEIDLLAGLSACPGGDCSVKHSSDIAQCYPLLIEVWDPGEVVRKKHLEPEVNSYQHEI